MRDHAAASGRLGPILVGWGLGAALMAPAAGGRAATAQGPGPAPGRAGTQAPIVSRPGPGQGQGQAPAPRPAPGGPLAFARQLAASRRYDLAADEYERYIQGVRAGTTRAAGDDLADAWFGLGMARLFLNRTADARQAFRGFLQSSPDHPNAPAVRYRIGEASFILGDDLADARRNLDAYTANPGAAPQYQETAWTYLGEIALRAADYPAARRAYAQALAGDSRTPIGSRARYGLGLALAAQRERGPALAVLRELAASGGPEWVDKAQLQIGQVEAAAGNWAGAVAAFEALEKASPRSPLVPRERLDRAEALNRLDRRAEAATLLRPIADDPQQPLSLAASEALGATLRLDKRPAEALAVYDAALARPNATGAAAATLRFQAAEAAQAANKPADARARFASLARDAPTSPQADDAQLRAAGLALLARDYADARRLAGGFAAAFPSSPLRADARLIDARAALDQGRPQDAIAVLSAPHAPDEPEPAPDLARRTAYTLGLAYQKAGQPDRAAELLGKLADGGADAGTPGASADASFLLGQADFEAGRHAEAIPALEKYLAARPTGEVAPDALARLAQSYAALGRDDAADAAVAKLAEAFPASPTLAPTRLRVAEFALDAKRFDRALPLLEALVRSLAPDADPALRRRALADLGAAQQGAGQPGPAAATFAALAELDPAGPAGQDARLAQARALQLDGKAAEAIAAYERAVAAAPDAPAAGPATLALARLQIEATRPSDAAKSLEVAATKYPDSCGRPLPAVLAEWAWCLAEAKQADAADAVLGRLLKDHPASPEAQDARLGLAESSYERRDLDRTRELLGPLVADGSTARPELVEPALLRLGQVEAERRDWPAAAQALDRLLKDFPAGPLHRDGRFWRAEVAFQADDPKKAEAELETLLAEAPAADDPPRMLALARGRLVQVLAEEGRWDDALKAAERREGAGDDPAGDPLAAEVDFARGRAFKGLARFDEALAAFEGVVAARPRTDLAAQAQWLRGEVLFLQGRYKEALLDYQKVILGYNSPKWQAAALLEAGKADEKLGNWAEAVRDYEKLLAQFPDDPNAADAARRRDAARRHAAGAPAPAPG